MNSKSYLVMSGSHGNSGFVCVAPLHEDLATTIREGLEAQRDFEYAQPCEGRSRAISCEKFTEFAKRNSLVDTGARTPVQSWCYGLGPCEIWSTKSETAAVDQDLMKRAIAEAEE